MKEMKKYLTAMLALMAVPLLMSTARADVIAGPAVTAAIVAMELLPWILVGAVVGVTAFLLRKFLKKKK